MSRYDIHPQMGRKCRARTLQDALGRARQLWPDATMEGSTGRCYSFWADLDKGEMDKKAVVGYAWGVKGSEDWWYRVASGAGDAVRV